MENENKPFNTFKNDLINLIQQTIDLNDLKITIYFYPFAYGNNFYDQPFEEDGRHVTAKELIEILTTTLKQELS